MSKTIKIWLIIATSLVILGAAIFVISTASVGWDFTKLGTGNYETKSYDITEDFIDISIKTDTADIVFKPSDDGKCRVNCYEETKVKHSVFVSNGVLMVDMVDTRKWYDHIGIHFSSPKITVYLPEVEYASLKIDESTGDIELSGAFRFENIDISVSTGDVMCYAFATGDIKIATSTGDINLANTALESLEVSVTTGDVKLSDILCKNFISSGNTGNITLKNVIVEEKISIERSTGDIKFDGADAAEIFAKTSTGDVTGSFLTDKVYIVETNTDDVDVPRTTTGGRCEITTGTGDISIKIKK